MNQTVRALPVVPRAARTPAPDDASVLAEVRHSELWAKSGPVSPLMTQGARMTPQAAAGLQPSAGNAAVQNLRAAARQEGQDKAKAAAAEETKAKADAAVEDAKDETKPEPTEAQKPGKPAAGKLAGGAPAQPASAAGEWPAEPAAGGGAASPDAATARAGQIAGQMPPGGSAVQRQPPSFPPPSAQPRAASPQALQRKAGKPPVPENVLPQPTAPDPIPKATEEIGKAANLVLPEQAMPEVKESPGHHMPDVTGKRLSQAEMRMILLGEPAMANAQLTEEAAKKLPEKEANEVRDQIKKLRDIREGILKPADSAVAAVTVPPVAPTPIVIHSEPLPPSTVGSAQQKIFTAVLARFMSDLDGQAKEMLSLIKTEIETYPGGIVEKRLPKLGEDQIPSLAGSLRQAVDPLAAQLGVAGQTLDDAVALRRQQVENARQAADRAARGAADKAADDAAAAALAKQAKAQAAAQAASKDAKAKAARMAKPPKPTARDQVQGAIQRIQDKVGEAIARYRLTLKDRNTALDDAAEKYAEAYRRAAMADELVLRPQGAPSPASVTADFAKEKQTRLAIAASNRWAREQSGLVRKAVDALKQDAKTSIDGFIKQVETAGGNAYAELKNWATAQNLTTESWWQETAGQLDRWAQDVHETATTWAGVETRLARLELQRDLATINELSQAQIAAEDAALKEHKDAKDKEKLKSIAEEGGRKGVADYLENTDSVRRRFIYETAGRDPIEQMAVSMRRRVAEMRKKEVQEAVIAKLLPMAQNRSLPADDFENLELIIRTKSSGFHAANISNRIWKYGEAKIGTDEDEIFKALTGLDELQVELVKTHYEQAHEGHTLYGDLDSEMSGADWRHAKDLMKGDPVLADVSSIYYAIQGAGTDEKLIMDTLRAMPAERRAAVEAKYLELHGESLDAALAGDLSGSELKQARSLAKGDKKEGNVYALDAAMRQTWSGIPDQEGVHAVYDQVREEVKAQAKAEEWTSSEYEAEIQARNAEIEISFNEKFKDVPQYRSDQGALRGGLRFGATRGERDLNNALADNNMTAADAAKLQVEREGVYADDDVINRVLRSQYDRALFETQLDEGPERRAGIKREVDKFYRDSVEAAAKDKTKTLKPKTWEEVQNKRLELEQKMTAEIEGKALVSAQGKSAALDQLMQGKYGATLDQVIENNMSGADRDQARAQNKLMRSTDPPAQLRKQFNYNRIRYSIEGLGTDVDELRTTIGGMTKAELAEANERWKHDHNGETLDHAISGDTSGREERDLLDQYKYGMPETVAEQIDELRRRSKADEEAVGAVGAWASKEESVWTKNQLARLDALEAEMKDPNLSPQRREQLSLEFELRMENAKEAIEAQRAAVDSIADMASQIFSYVVGAIAIIAGVIVSIVTGGAALPAVIAIAGSIVGTLGSMAIKAAIKGSDYGAGEIATDLAVGAVDLIVTMATLGAFKGGNLLKMAMAEGKQFMATSVKASLGKALGRAIASFGKKAGEEGLAMRILKGGAGLIEGIVKEQPQEFLTALPTALTANLADENNWRNGNPLVNISKGTLRGAGENLVQGLGMSAGSRALRFGLGHALTVHPPSSTPVGVRLAEFKSWQKQNPGKPHSDFVAHMEVKQAVESQRATETQKFLKDARREMLKNIPPAERKGFADVPVLRVPEAEFRALNKGKGGDAMVHVKDGQVSLIMREGAPANAAAVHAQKLRDLVAPGTAGRTIMPGDALPPRLRNRVPVEVNPKLAHDTVRVVPDYHPNGHIRGVRVEVGPNARAIDIQKHVGVIDTMRKYTGLLGRLRVAIQRVQLRLGADIVSPLSKGHFEAALELQKLPGIIEQRIGRLAREGADPRARAEIEADIVYLERQFHDAEGRLGLGSTAESVGHVAAEGRPRRKKGAPADPTKQEIIDSIDHLAANLDEVFPSTASKKNPPPTREEIALAKHTKPRSGYETNALKTLAKTDRAAHDAYLKAKKIDPEGLDHLISTETQSSQKRALDGGPPLHKNGKAVVGLANELAKAGMSKGEIEALRRAVPEMGKARYKAMEGAGTLRRRIREDTLAHIEDPVLRDMVAKDKYILGPWADIDRLRLNAGPDTGAGGGAMLTLKDHWDAYNRNLKGKAPSRSGFVTYLRGKQGAVITQLRPALAEMTASFELGQRRSARSVAKTNLPSDLRFLKDPVDVNLKTGERTLNPKQAGTDLVGFREDGKIWVIDDKSHRSRNLPAEALAPLTTNLAKNMTADAKAFRTIEQAAEAAGYPLDPKTRRAIDAYEKCASELTGLTKNWKEADFNSPAKQKAFVDVLARNGVELKVTSAAGNIQTIPASHKGFGIRIIR
ncbi:hypothetical protein BQ8794_50734 [Mesorhizobium prunaredense]|uniref:Annexin n=1 Tax=Mesorhizobium prunaredense TaxID=1631249 RepID=A0A1R3VIE0_9HYPH|nr:hypothetical protein [Mesorhizobium prunaredense]SIT58632.1 hypothetical protein BQ8794_50734 [Mesorhizobium prunaredense]